MYDFLFDVTEYGYKNSYKLRYANNHLIARVVYRNVPLQACMHKVPIDASKRGSQWPEQWLARLEKPPYWLLSSQIGVYGNPAPEDFIADYEHWKRVVAKSYLNGLGISWSNVRNDMDMRSIYGG